MSLDRITRARLFRDEALFNELLPYSGYDEENSLFIHADASIWSVWELSPLILTSTSDAQAFQTTQTVQEMLDSMDHKISIQFNSITTFDVEPILDDCLKRYPSSGPAGWMAQKWAKMIKREAAMSQYGRRPRKFRLLVSFRYDAPWRKKNLFFQFKEAFETIFTGKVGISSIQRRTEYLSYATKFKGEVDGKISILRDLGMAPRRINAQDFINIMYPILNRKSTRGGKLRGGRSTAVQIPKFDSEDYLSNQVSDTSVEHPANGIIKKDGRVYRSISMVKAPKRCLPIMIAPLQAAPCENILTITYSRDSAEQQLRRLDQLDATLGFREHTSLGRGNQKIQQQISSIRNARQALYSNTAQIVRAGVHQTFIAQNEDEAIRATSEAVATMTQMHGARGMVHEISDLGVLVNSLPAAYDPSLDGPGWTQTLTSSRAVRLFPLWGNWQGSQGSQIVLPSLLNRELISFDLFDSNIAPNVLISGVSGAGKSYLLCYLLTHLNRGHYSNQANGQKIERPPITFIFDKGMPNQPCGFDKLAKLFGGRIYEASPSKAPAMNFLARLGNTNYDNTNEDFKDLVDISSDIILDMATEGDKKPGRMQRADVIKAILEAHRLYRNGPRKREFILSDVVSVLRAPKRIDEDDDSSLRRQEIAVFISDYYGEGTYARFFDRPGALKLKERFIVFDLKGLNRNPDLQRIFLKIAMLWADTVMNDPAELDTRKILVFDEAHDLIGKTSAGVIESAFRLYRKRKGMVIAASQSGEDFYVGEGGQAIVQNSAHKIFLRQDPSKFHLTGKAFNLSEQQLDVITRLRTIKGVESQFYMISDIGEAALVLPLEPTFYWVATNNGDDNQLFQAALAQNQDNFWLTLEQLSLVAPNGAAEFMRMQQAYLEQMNRENQDSSEVNGIVKKAIFKDGDENGILEETKN